MFLKIKGIAIILMLFHHLFRIPDLYKGYEIIWFPLSENLVVSLADMSKICVALFVFISGYGMALKMKKSAKVKFADQLINLISRFILLFIPIMIAGQFINQRPQNFYLSGNLFEGGVYLIVDMLGLSNLLGLTPYYGAYLYISAAIVFIIISPIIYSLIKSKGGFFVLSIIVILPRLLGIGYIPGNAIYPFLFSLALGCIFADKNYMEKVLNWYPIKSANKWINNLILLFLGILCLIVSYYLYEALPIEKYWEISWGIIPAIFLCFCAKFIVNIPIIGVLLEWLGKYSMNIYIIHVFYIGYFKDFLYSFKYFGIVVFLLVILSFLTSIILAKLEKPLLNLINNKLQAKKTEKTS